MATMIGRTGRWLVAACSAAALGFGASQAVASPRGAQETARCETGSCDRACKRTRPDLVGVCVNNVCQCLAPVPQ